MAEKKYDVEDITKFTNVDNIKTSPVDDKAFIPTNTKQDALSGVLDIVLNTVSVNLDAQRKSGRIRQEEYAQAYIALFQSALQAAMQYFLQKDKTAAEIALLEKQIQLTDKEIEKAEEQIETYKRQRKAYDEDYMVKALGGLIDPYIAFLTSMPNVDNQPYPSMFTSFYKPNEVDEPQVDKQPKKLRYIDALMGRIYSRVAEYAKDMPT